MVQALTLIGSLVALLLAVSLLALAVLHAYWGAGGRWPGNDELSLARMVVGRKGIAGMPGEAASYGVAGALFIAGLWPLMMVRLLPALLPPELVLLGAYGLAGLFLARGAASYLAPFRDAFPEEPFATLDRRLYGPICLAIGFGFAFILSLGWITP